MNTMFLMMLINILLLFILTMNNFLNMILIMFILSVMIFFVLNLNFIYFHFYMFILSSLNGLVLMFFIIISLENISFKNFDNINMNIMLVIILLFSMFKKESLISMESLFYKEFSLMKKMILMLIFLFLFMFLFFIKKNSKMKLKFMKN